MDLTTRIALRRLLEQHPGASDEDLRYFEYVISSVDAGMAEASRGQTVTHEELKHRMRRRWPVTRGT